MKLGGTVRKNKFVGRLFVVLAPLKHLDNVIKVSERCLLNQGVKAGALSQRHSLAPGTFWNIKAPSLLGRQRA